MDSFRYLVTWLFIMAVIYLVASAVVMASWNFSVPKLVDSVDSTYYTSGGKSFANITYDTALVLTLFAGAFFAGSSHLFNYKPWKKLIDHTIGEDMEDDEENEVRESKSKGKKKSSESYSNASEW